MMNLKRDDIVRKLEAPAKELLAAIDDGAVLAERWASVVASLRDVTLELDAFDQAQADDRAWRLEPADVEGGRLIVGEWYDVTVKIGSQLRSKLQTWRNCRYRGRSKGFGNDVSYGFARWGADAATAAYARGKADSVSEHGLVSVTPIVVDPRIPARIEADAKAAAEREAAYEARRAARA